MSHAPGLGTQLRLLTALLDGDVQALYEEAGAPFRPRFFPIVRQLLSDGSAPVSVLARATGVSQPAATQTIRQMADLGLVTLSAGEDARQRMVRLTPRGMELADQLQPLWSAVALAAHDLDLELPHPLAETLGAALDALAREPFKSRILRRLGDG